MSQPVVYAIDLDDPRAPTEEQWAAMSDSERARVVAALPSDVPFELFMPEGDRHRTAKNRAVDALGGFFKRIGRRVYVSSELGVYYPGQRRFAPDVLAVLDVERHERDKWVVQHEGKGLDLVLEIHVAGNVKKDYEAKHRVFGLGGIALLAILAGCSSDETPAAPGDGGTDTAAEAPPDGPDSKDADDSGGPSCQQVSASAWIEAIAAAPDSSFVVAGRYSGTMHLAGATLEPTGNNQLFVARLDSDLKLRWIRGYPVEVTEVGVDVNAGGLIALGGQFNGSLASLGGTHLGLADSADSGIAASRIFVAALAGDGQPKWNRGLDSYSFAPSLVHVDDAGNISMNAQTKDAFEIEPGQWVPMNAGLVVRLAPTGQIDRTSWSDRQFPHSMDGSPTGDLAVGGLFASSPAPDGGVQSAAGLFLQVTTPNDQVRWTHEFANDPSPSESFAVAWRAVILADGTTFFAGGYGNPVDLGGGPLPLGPGCSTNNIFVGSFDPVGNHRWSRGIVGPSPCSPDVYPLLSTTGLAAGPNGDVWLTGNGGNVGTSSSYPDTPLNFGDSPQDALETQGAYSPDLTNSEDLYLARFSRDGAHLWSRSFGVVKSAKQARGIAALADGSVVIVGSYDVLGEPLALGCGALPTTDHGFIVRYLPAYFE